MRRSHWGMILAALCVAVWAVPVFAQPPGQGQGRGFGGRGGFGGGFGRGDMTFALLRVEDVRTELNVSEEQQEQLTALQEEMQASQPDFRQVFQDLGEDATEEERNAAMAELREQMDAHQAEAKTKLAEILAADQLDRLRQIRLQVSGIGALRDTEVEEALALSEEQQQEIEELLDQQNDARRELGRDATEEERAAFNEEWDTKVKDVLTQEQKDEFVVMLGDTFEFDRSQLFGGFGGGRGGFGGPGGQGGPGGFGGPGGRPGGRPDNDRPESDRPETDDDEV